MQEELSDKHLVERFLEGDQHAFNELIKKYQSRIYWVARRMTGNHIDADDVVQEVLITAYSKLDTFKFGSSFYTWIYRITVRKCLNSIRSRKVKRFFNLDDMENEMTSHPDYINDISNREKLDKLDKVLQKLPEKQRQVFIFRNFDELSYEEIAEITGTSVGGLKANYFNAMEKVNKYINN